MKIYLLRHGEAIDDIEDCYGGISDFSLSDGGRDTAKELAKKLSDSGIQLLYSSPYKRAYETASIIAEDLKCKVREIDGLRERNSYGVLSGVNKAKAKEVFGHILDKLQGKAGDYYSDELVPGAEPRDEFDARVKFAFEQMVSDANQQGLSVIGAVTHGNVTRSFYRNILEVKNKIGLDLLAITIVEYIPAHITLESNQGVEIKD